MVRCWGVFWYDVDCIYVFNVFEKICYYINVIGKNGVIDNELVVIGYFVWSGGIWLYYCCDLFVVYGERCRFIIVNCLFLDVSWFINCVWLFWLVMGSKMLGGFVLFDGEFVGVGYLCVVYFCQ